MSKQVFLGLLALFLLISGGFCSPNSGVETMEKAQEGISTGESIGEAACSTGVKAAAIPGHSISEGFKKAFDKGGSVLG